MKTIYIISCETGRYDDYITRIVKAVTSESDAKTFVKYMNNWLLENGVSYDSPGTEEKYFDYEFKDNLKTEHDPGFYFDYTGARYTYAPCDLED